MSILINYYEREQLYILKITCLISKYELLTLLEWPTDGLQEQRRRDRVSGLLPLAHQS